MKNAVAKTVKSLEGQMGRDASMASYSACSSGFDQSSQYV